LEKRITRGNRGAKGQRRSRKIASVKHRTSGGKERGGGVGADTFGKRSRNAPGIQGTKEGNG